MFQYSPENILKEINKLVAGREISTVDKFAFERANRLLAVVLAILCNMEICNRFLSELNSEITKRCNPQNKSKPPEKYKYCRIVDMSLPVPSDDISLEDDEAARFLEQILLENEQKHGINLNLDPSKIPVFVGIVPKEKADAVQLSNYIWNDYNGNLTGFLHGRLSHRLQYYIILRALDEKLIDVKLLLSYINLDDKPGAILKYLLPSLTNFEFFNLIPVGRYRRAHWHLGLETITANPWSTLDFLPKAIDGELQCLAGPPLVMQYLHSTKAFELFPTLARAMFNITFTELRKVAKELNKLPSEVFIYYVNIANNIAFPEKEILGKALNKVLMSLTKEATAIINSPPKLKKEPTSEHATKKHKQATQDFKDNNYENAAQRFLKASCEFERLHMPTEAAISLFSYASIQRRKAEAVQGDAQVTFYKNASTSYYIAFRMRFFVLGAKHEETEKALTRFNESSKFAK